QEWVVQNWLTGGTFTISNLGGPLGVHLKLGRSLWIRTIIRYRHPAQAGILDVGTSEKRVVPGAGPDQLAVASFMPVLIFKVNCKCGKS
ncbi:hypothetical protein MKW92_009188, partial [Papaver armeniacum]